MSEMVCKEYVTYFSQKQKILTLQNCQITFNKYEVTVPGSSYVPEIVVSALCILTDLFTQSRGRRVIVPMCWQGTRGTKADF